MTATALPAFPLQYQSKSRPLRSTPAARPSTDAPSRTESNAPAPAELEDHRGARRVRCGIAPATRRSGRVRPRAATLQKMYSEKCTLHEAAPHRWGRWPGARRSPRAPADPLRRMHRKRGGELHPRTALADGHSSQLSQLAAQLASGAKQGIFHGLFGCAECIADRAKLQSLVMLHLKNNTFSGR